MATEGQTAIGPYGQRAVFRGGRWVASGGGIPPNPIKVRQAQLETAGKGLQNQQTQVETASKSATLPYAAPKAAADVRLTEANAAKAEREVRMVPDEQRKAAMQAGNLDALVNQINRTQELFDKSQAGGPGIGSLLEYLPLPANKQFDAAGAGLAEQGLAAFRVPGVGSQSDAELRQFVEANKPSSWSQDSQNTERLRQLRMRVETTRKALGLPPAQWGGAQQGGGPRQAINAERAKLEQQLAGLPPAARQLGLRKFDSDQRVKRHAKPSGSNVIDFNDLP